MTEHHAPEYVEGVWCPDCEEHIPVSDYQDHGPVPCGDNDD